MDILMKVKSLTVWLLACSFGPARFLFPWTSGLISEPLQYKVYRTERHQLNIIRNNSKPWLTYTLKDPCFLYKQDKWSLQKSVDCVYSLTGGLRAVRQCFHQERIKIGGLRRQSSVKQQVYIIIHEPAYTVQQHIHLQKYYPPEEFFDGGIAVCGSMKLLHE